MKKILILFLILMPITFAQITLPTPPSQQQGITPEQQLVINKITQEHLQTRKFMVDLFDQKSQVFFDEADKRLNWMEARIETLINEAVFKLGLLWLGVTIFSMCFILMLSTMFQRRKYRKMKADILNEIKAELNKQIEITKNQEVPIKTQEQNVQKPQADLLRQQEQQAQIQQQQTDEYQRASLKQELYKLQMQLGAIK